MCSAIHWSSHIPDEKGVSEIKLKTNHQTFSTGGHGRLGTRLLTTGNTKAKQELYEKSDKA